MTRNVCILCWVKLEVGDVYGIGWSYSFYHTLLVKIAIGTTL
jgi:hypothetical protein